jgi:hypothetical protein
MVCCGRTGSIEKSSTAESFRNGKTLHLFHPCKPWFVSMKCLPSENACKQEGPRVHIYIRIFHFFLFCHIDKLIASLKDAKALL